MGRQARYPAELLLDAAAGLVAEHGPTAVTMSAVGAAVGAPSGSVYHRFPDRPSLHAALWLRVTTTFHSAVATNLRGEPVDAAVRCARASVRWCHDHHELACVLVAGKDAFSPAAWSIEGTALVDAEQRAFERRVQAALRHLKVAGSGVTRDRLALAVFDLPYAAVRRYLTSGRRVPRSLDTVVESAARALLVPPSDAQREDPTC